MTTAVHTYECNALDEKFQDLKQKLDIAFGEQNECPFFRIICEQIVPSLLSHPHLEIYRKEWVHGREEHAKKHRQYEKQTIAEIKQSFKTLWDRYKKIKQCDPMFTDLFESIERVLDAGERRAICYTPRLRNGSRSFKRALHFAL